MLQKDKLARDAFTLSLGGMQTISSFVIAPAIAHDRLRQQRDGQACDTSGQKWRLWKPRLFRAT